MSQYDDPIRENEPNQRATDRRLRDLFADVSPAADFEDRLIAGFRQQSAPRRLRIYPVLWQAAASAAAVLVLGTVGYVGSQHLGGSAKPASSLRQIGQALLAYSNDNQKLYEIRDLDNDGDLDTGAPAAQPEAAKTAGGEVERWHFGGGGNNALDWSKWNELPGIKQNLSYKDYGAQQNNSAAGSGFKLNNSIGSEFAVATDLSNKQSAAKQGNASNHDEEGKNALYGDGRASFDKNPFVGGQRDNVDTTKLQATSHTGGSAVQPLVDGNDSILLPAHGGGDAPATQSPDPVRAPAAPTTTAAAVRKVIRNGELEFEVDHFDAAVTRLTAVVNEEGGYVGTTNSEKLPNGKVKGTITARVAPDRLDSVVTKLRALGDLKRQNLTAQDVTKQYTDLDSELRAARALESRLLDVIKTGKGEIKDLLAAEKELGVVRAKLEKVQGEMNYYNNLVALSTLQVTMYEKDIQQAASLTETETADVGVETEDVEKARAEAIKAIDEAKGRIVESQLKQFDAGQLNARVVAEVAPERAGQVIDRIKQLGKVARLDVQRQTVTSNGSPAPNATTNAAGPAPRVERRETRIVASFYNLANLAPRTTTAVNLACDDLEKTYRAIMARAVKADGGRIVSSNINRQTSEQGTASITFEVKSADADAVLNDVKSSGEPMRIETTENTDTASVTTAKRALVVQLVPFASAPPRQVITRNLAAADVAKSFNGLLDAARKAGARVVVSRLEQNSGQPTSASLDLEVRRENAPAIDAAIGASGDIVGGSVAVAPDQQATLESKVQYKLGVAPADQLPPRERTVLTIENRDVESSAAAMAQATSSAGGRVVDSSVAKEPSGRTVARLVLDLPIDKAPAIVDRARESGIVRVSQTSKNNSAAAGALARARIELTLASPERIVEEGRGVWSTLRNGLSTSAAGLMWSLQLIVIGLCLVAPWALLIWGGWRLLRRWRGREVATT